MEAYWTLRSLQNRQILYFPLHQSINYNSFEIHLPLPFIRAQNSILPMRFGNGSVWSPIVAKDTFSSPNFIFFIVSKRVGTCVGVRRPHGMWKYGSDEVWEVMQAHGVRIVFWTCYVGTASHIAWVSCLAAQAYTLAQGHTD